MLTIVAGMPRSGSTWMYQVMTELLQRRHPRILGLGYRSPPDPRIFTADQQVIVKWHDACSTAIVRAAVDQVRVIYSYRDLRSCVYSKAYKGMRDLVDEINELPMMLHINAFWECTSPDVMMRYEDFWQDSRPFVVSLARLVGEFTDAEIDEVHAKFSFDANKQRTNEAAQEMSLHGVDLADLAASCSFDHDKLLHWNHIRNGVSDDWRNASERELRLFSRILTPWLLRKRYEKHANWVDRLLEARAQQGGCDGKEAAETQADRQRKRWLANGGPDTCASSTG